MLGSNVPAHPGLPPDGLAELFRYADDWGCECAQTYVTLSRTWKVRGLLPEEVSNFKSAWRRSRVKQVIAHVPLIVNLASPHNEIRQRSKDRLSAELSRANELGINALVLHPGSYGKSDRKVGIDRLTDALRIIVDKQNHSTTRLLLETTSGQGTALGSRFEEMAQVLQCVDRPEVLGLCLDTCHVFAAGYDFHGYQGCARVLTELDAKIGLDKLKVFHLNDSKEGLGSKIDRHASIGVGKMGLQIFHALVSDSRFGEIPMILEIPERDPGKIRNQIELLHKLQTASARIAESEDIGNQSRIDELLFKSR